MLHKLTQWYMLYSATFSPINFDYHVHPFEQVKQLNPLKRQQQQQE